MADGSKRRLSEIELEEQDDLVIDLTLRRFVYGTVSGLAAAIFMFRNPTKRWSSMAFGAGAGLGSAYADASRILGDRMIFPTFPKSPPK